MKQSILLDLNVSTIRENSTRNVMNPLVALDISDTNIVPQLISLAPDQSLILSGGQICTIIMSDNLISISKVGNNSWTAKINRLWVWTDSLPSYTLKNISLIDAAISIISI